jgi:uncharacterized integral membrane protein
MESISLWQWSASAHFSPTTIGSAVDEGGRPSVEPPRSVPEKEQPVSETEPAVSVSSGVSHTRTSAAWTAVAIAVVLGVALIAFVVQNTQKIQIKFFGASGHIPLVVTLLAAAIVGALIVLVVGISRITQLRLSARRRSKRTMDVEKNSRA